MSDEKPKGGSLLLGLTLAAVLLVPCLYAASVGPVVRYWDDATGSSSWRIVYAPLGWLHDHTFLRDPLEWYVGLWMELPGPRD